MFLVTDPDRTPNPAAIAARLPHGAGVIYRAFGRPDAVPAGRRLARVARAHGLVLLVGADDGLAAALRADGVHLPERLLHRGPSIRRRRPRWIVTGAAHSAPAVLRARRFGLHAALLSPVFPSRSPSAGQPLGVVRFAALVRGAGLPVLALGGVGPRSAPRLRGSGAAGLAAIEGLAPAQPAGAIEP